MQSGYRVLQASVDFAGASMSPPHPHFGGWGAAAPREGKREVSLYALWTLGANFALEKFKF